MCTPTMWTSIVHYDNCVSPSEIKMHMNGLSSQMSEIFGVQKVVDLQYSPKVNLLKLT